MKPFFYAFALMLLFSAEKCDDVSSDKYSNGSEDIVQIQRTGCYGACPIFTFTLNGDGNATYDGMRFVDKVGVFNKTFNEHQTNALFKAFELKEFSSFEDEYTANVTDLPTTYLTRTVDGKTKRVKMYYNVPADLINLAKLVDSYANSKDWKKSEK